MAGKRFYSGIFAVIVLFSFFCSARDAHSSGFAIYTQGSSALGMADAVISQTDDASAIFFNPALINGLEGTQIVIGTTLISPSREFRSDLTGDNYETESALFYPATLFITHKYNEKLSLGLGVFNPFGLGTDWGDDWEGRYVATSSEIKTFNINPVVSYRITPAVSFAAGLEFLLLDAVLEKKINLSALGLPDAGQRFDGDGDGIGYNFGILFDINEDISAGASYRSEVRIDIDGDASFDLPVDALAVTFPDTGGSTEITLPRQVYAGISYKGIDRLRIETGLRWEGWSSYDRLKIDLDKSVSGSETLIADKSWRDTWSVNLGARYQLNDMFTLRGGYLYGGTPIPDDTFEPSIPDGKTHLFTLGAGMDYGKFSIDMAYGYQRLERRNKNNSIDDIPGDGIFNSATSANGWYDTVLHLLGVSLTYRF